MAAAVHRPDRVARIAAIQTGDLREMLAWADRVDRRRLIRTPILGQLLVRFTRRRLAGNGYRVAAGDRNRVEPFTRLALDAKGWVRISPSPELALTPSRVYGPRSRLQNFRH